MRQALLFSISSGLVLAFAACRPAVTEDRDIVARLEQTVAALAAENATLAARPSDSPARSPPPEPTTRQLEPTPAPQELPATEAPSPTPSVLQISVLKPSGEFIWLGFGSELQLLDASNPANLRRVASFDLGAEVRDIVEQAPHLYVAAADGLHIFDVSDRLAAQELSFMAFPRPLQQVSVGPFYVYLKDDWSSLRVVDALFPDYPLEVAFLQLVPPGSPRTILLEDQYVYVVHLYLESRLLDYTDPFFPQEVGSFQPQGEVHGAWVSQGLFILEDLGPNMDATVVAVDFLQSGEPRSRILPLPEFADPLLEAVVSDDLAILSLWGGELHVFRLPAAGRGRSVGIYRREGGHFRHLTVHGAYLFAVWGEDSVLALDIHDPAEPAEVGIYLASYGE